MKLNSHQYNRKKISTLLGKENGNSIVVLYYDVNLPYKYKYLSYNNLKKLKVYSILILDYPSWINKLQTTMNEKNLAKCFKFFEYYGLKPHNSVSWNCYQWSIQSK